MPHYQVFGNMYKSLFISKPNIAVNGLWRGGVGYILANKPLGFCESWHKTFYCQITLFGVGGWGLAAFASQLIPLSYGVRYTLCVFLYNMNP